MGKCLKCEKGTYNNGYNETKCNKCPTGYFSPLEGSTLCSQCIPGTYSDIEGVDKCYNCEPGTYNNLFGQSKCFNCGRGNYSLLEGSLECIKCPIGTFNSLIKNNHCEDCERGYYNDQIDASQCKKCPINHYSDEKGLSYCKICEENKYSLIGFSKCKFCEDTIPHCNTCSKDAKCLECNNNAVNGFHNCSICENTIDWKFTGEYCKLTICPKNYYKDKNNNIHCIGDISECPEGMDYLNSNTGECQEKPSLHHLMDFQYKVNGGIESLNKASNELIFQYKNFSDYAYEFYSKNKNKIKIEGLDSNVLFGPKDNLKNPNDVDIGVDLGDCPEIVRLKYDIKNIICKVVDLTIDGTKIIDFELYDTDNLETPLNKSYCENQTITIISPPYDYLDYFENIEEFEVYFQLMKEGIDIFNAYSPIYNDPCFPLSVLNKYDVTLRDRRNFISKKKFPLCEEGCQYEGENLKTFQVICYCQIKTDKEREPNLNKIKSGFLSLKYRNNFNVLKCYSLVFSSKGQTKNYFSYIYLLLLALNIIIITITECFFDDNLKKLIKECKEYIIKNNSNNKDEKNREFRKLIKIYLKNKKNKELNEEEKEINDSIERCKNEKILNKFENRAINDDNVDKYINKTYDDDYIICDNYIKNTEIKPIDKFNQINDDNNNIFINNGFCNKIKVIFICIINGIRQMFICGEDI